MNTVINGKSYNTQTAVAIAAREAGVYITDFNYLKETLYRKKTGEFFLAGKGGAMTRYSHSYSDNSWGGGSKIIPLDYYEAKGWVERYAPESYEELFGEVEEKTEEKS